LFVFFLEKLADTYIRLVRPTGEPMSLINVIDNYTRMLINGHTLPTVRITMFHVDTR